VLQSFRTASIDPNARRPQDAAEIMGSVSDLIELLMNLEQTV
jgi:hypothetical protein